VEVIVGIDPGNKGGIVALDGQTAVLAEPMPATPKVGLDLYALIELLEGLGPIRMVVLERAQSMPGQGIATTFRYGVGYGGILGVLAALRLPHTTVTPAVWHRDLVGHRPSEGRDQAKARALQVVRQRLPGLQVVPPRCRTPHDGLVDAACLALWGQR